MSRRGLCNHAVVTGILVFLGVACGEVTSAPDAGPGPGNEDAGVAADARAGDAMAADGGFRWPVDTGSVAITPSDAWKNHITATDPFVFVGEPDPMTGTPSARWIKFVVLMRDPSRVFFQDSRRYPFHSDLITAHLDPFLGLSREEIDRRALHEDGQELILGAVLFPPSVGIDELGIQLVRQDAYHPEMARRVLELVRQGVETSSATHSYYFPTFEQAAAAQRDEAFFEASGFPLSSAERWGDSGACYASGWALGRLVYVPSADIDAAYTDGRLEAADVLLTDGVPAEVPFVAGILSLEPATPNSHVAILARSYGVPFAFVRDADERVRIRGLAGSDVVVRTDGSFGGCELQVLDASGALDPQQRADIVALKAPPPLQFPEKARRGALSADTDELSPADARYFGGKASNFGLLRDAIPEASPHAIALSFDLWDAFMAQRLADQKTLGETIAARLAPHRTTGDLAALRFALAEVRDLVDGAAFPSAERTGVLAALAGFDPLQRIRFRSSTNVEDGASFVGAGLYDSESGCLADDLDADELGPSACDAARIKERGVLRAIQKVYTSFYADNAYLERLRRGVDESKVGMAVLVHHSFPDEDELANGVATLNWGAFARRAEMVTQLGAVSVANPEGGARPEVVDADTLGDRVYVSVRAPSSLVPLGATVMRAPEDYEALMRLLVRVGQVFADRSGRSSFVLDLEYKRIRPGGLVVKQVREVPQPGPEQVPTFLLADTERRCTAQGESGDVFANHRMKSRWTISTRSTWLGAVGSTVYGDVALELVDDGRVVQSTGALDGRPGFTNGADGDALLDSWQVPATRERQVDLRTTLPREVRAPKSPIQTLRDGYLTASARWSSPVFELDFNGTPATRVEDYTVLGGCPEDHVVDGRTPLVEREAVVAGKRVRTAFYWPEPSGGATAGYTAPLHKWRETVIEGFTSQPIVLRGYWSQTYRPGHHNFSEDFIFEPRLEEGLSAAQQAELETANVRWIHVTVGFADPLIAVMGVDGVYRAL